ncbi:RNA polymerase sigma-70 factor [Prolixibacteraceae bacterium JC049]|nr:RNA polymerase sigma-70 factor [Prolixibacteraceae bacterium JC049]
MIETEKEHLLNALKNRDLNAYEAIFFQYHGRLVLFAYKFIGDMQVAKDLVQDAFMLLWDKANTIQINHSVKAYLYQSIKNSCLNYNRHTKIKQSVQHTLETETNEFSNNDPYYSLIELELEEKIAEVIESLPPKCKEVFKLSRFEQLKNREIADQMSISVKMVEKHISKAIQILRQQLTEFLSLFMALLLENWDKF